MEVRQLRRHREELVGEDFDMCGLLEDREEGLGGNGRRVGRG